jgi:formylglycine-generating enzyme required for sulfatase activity
MLHQLPDTAKRLGLAPTQIDTAEPVNDWVTLPEYEVTLGLAREQNPFVAWDNEYDAQRQRVPTFRMQRYPVTNGAFLKFVEAGGYEERSLWRDDDWSWRVRAGVEHPAFWQRSGSRWLWRSMFTRVPLPLAWPVYVSHAEASAYARYLGKQLPTEEQWQRAALQETAEGGAGPFASGRYDPSPVRARAGGNRICDLVGNGWNWTSTPFAPLPNFVPQPFYPEYSTRFFDGRHFVLKGASPRTDRSLVRPSFRNWFQPHYPYVYANFRCVDAP